LAATSLAVSYVVSVHQSLSVAYIASLIVTMQHIASLIVTMQQSLAVPDIVRVTGVVVSLAAPSRRHSRHTRARG